MATIVPPKSFRAGICRLCFPIALCIAALNLTASIAVAGNYDVPFNTTCYQADGTINPAARLIFTADDLKRLSANARTNPRKTLYCLMNSIKWDPAKDGVFTPIDHFWEQTFDGLNETIDGLVVDGTSGRSLGLFGQTNCSTIKNLTVRNISFANLHLVNSTSGSTVSAIYLGGLVGDSIGSTFENVHVHSNIIVKDLLIDDLTVGGVLGTLYGSAKDSGFVGHIEISTRADRYRTPYLMVGGFAGAALLSTVDSVYVHPARAGSRGSITVDSSNIEMIEIGGLLGHDDRGKLSRSYSRLPLRLIAPTSGTPKVPSVKAGGIAGYTASWLPYKWTELYFSGEMEFQPKSYSSLSVGGLAGDILQSDAWGATELNVERSYWNSERAKLTTLASSASMDRVIAKDSGPRTTKQMTLSPGHETYNGWSFAETWKRPDGRYPYLRHVRYGLPVMTNPYCRVGDAPKTYQYLGSKVTLECRNGRWFSREVGCYEGDAVDYSQSSDLRYDISNTRVCLCGRWVSQSWANTLTRTNPAVVQDYLCDGSLGRRSYDISLETVETFNADGTATCVVLGTDVNYVEKGMAVRAAQCTSGSSSSSSSSSSAGGGLSSSSSGSSTSGGEPLAGSSSSSGYSTLPAPKGSYCVDQGQDAHFIYTPCNNGASIMINAAGYAQANLCRNNEVSSHEVYKAVAADYCPNYPSPRSLTLETVRVLPVVR